VLRELPTVPPPTVLEVGKSIFFALDSESQEQLRKMALKNATKTNAYAKLDLALDNYGFDHHLRCASEKPNSYNRSVVLARLLSAAGEKWSIYQPNNTCTGYCSQLEEYHVVNATEKLKVSLFGYLYFLRYGGGNDQAIMGVLGRLEQHRTP